jgi:hypothetical protein
MSKVTSAALAKLLDSSEIGVACSVFTIAQRDALENLGRKTGALRVETSGRGSVFRILDRIVLEGHLVELRPLRPDQLDSSIPNRAFNIAISRNSKVGETTHDKHYLLIKAISGDIIWEDPNANQTRRLNLSEVTTTAGVGALALDEEDAWCSDAPLWLVENQALFDRLDWLPEGTRGTVAYYAGQLPSRLLRWLGKQHRSPEVILFPDYDGVGLLNYARLKESCSSPCSFWLMPDWKQRLNTFGNNQIWQNTQQEFHSAIERLRLLGMDDGIEELCVSMSSQGLALEHESIWLTSRDQS